MGYTQPLFNVRKIAGGYKIYPDGVATDDLTIHPNPVDTAPSVELYGGSIIRLNAVTGAGVLLKTGSDIGRWSFTSPDMTLATVAGNYNICLTPDGTGKVKFGTRTATGDAVSNGYITILDEAGNTVKLMTTA